MLQTTHWTPHTCETMTTPQTTRRATNIRSVPPPRTMEFHHAFPKAPTAASTRLQGNRAAAAQAALHPYHTPYVNRAHHTVAPCAPTASMYGGNNQHTTTCKCTTNQPPSRLCQMSPPYHERAVQLPSRLTRDTTQAHTHCPLFTRHAGRQEGQHTQGSTHCTTDCQSCESSSPPIKTTLQ